MKIKVQSGFKELKFNHRAVWNLQKRTGRELFDLFGDITQAETANLKLTTMYELLFAALSKEYETIEDMLDDLLGEEFQNYIKAIGDSVGKLFGGNFEAK